MNLLSFIFSLSHPLLRISPGISHVTQQVNLNCLLLIVYGKYFSLRFASRFATWSEEEDEKRQNDLFF